MPKALILDLDDTIYPTRSLDREQVQPFFDALVCHNDTLPEDVLDEAMEAMWIKPIHIVAREYGFSESMYLNSMKSLTGRKFKFTIRPYKDYELLLKPGLPLFLVTTGSTELQKAKISSLKIEDHFQEVFIDDPMIVSGGKARVFRKLMKKYHYLPSELLVIGDNPDSEIQAAKELGIPTLLIVRSSKFMNEPGTISDFAEVLKFLKMKSE